MRLKGLCTQSCVGQREERTREWRLVPRITSASITGCWMLVAPGATAVSPAQPWGQRGSAWHRQHVLPSLPLCSPACVETNPEPFAWAAPLPIGPQAQRIPALLSLHRWQVRGHREACTHHGLVCLHREPSLDALGSRHPKAPSKARVKN